MYMKVAGRRLEISQGLGVQTPFSLLQETGTQHIGRAEMPQGAMMVARLQAGRWETAR